MRCSLMVQSSEYELAFDRPIFDLATRHLDVLRACYDRIADVSGVRLADLQSLGGASFADSVARIVFPDLSGSAEFRVDRLFSQFGLSASPEQRQRQELVAVRCEEALRAVFPDLVIGSSSISIQTWLDCDGGRQDIRATLDRHHKPNFDIRTLGAESGTFSLRGQLENKTEGWQLVFTIEPSAFADHDLYAACSGTYGKGSRYTDWHEQGAHMTDMSDAILNAYGFGKGA